MRMPNNSVATTSVVLKPSALTRPHLHVMLPNTLTALFHRFKLHRRLRSFPPPLLDRRRFRQYEHREHVRGSSSRFRVFIVILLLPSTTFLLLCESRHTFDCFVVETSAAP